MFWVDMPLTVIPNYNLPNKLSNKSIPGLVYSAYCLERPPLLISWVSQKR